MFLDVSVYTRYLHRCSSSGIGIGKVKMICEHLLFKRPLVHLGLTLTLSHLSTHFAWNSWLQGSTRSSWRVSKSHMQTTHLRGDTTQAGCQGTAGARTLLSGAVSLRALVLKLVLTMNPLDVVQPARNIKMKRFIYHNDKLLGKI